MKEAKQEARTDGTEGDKIDVQRYGTALTWTRGPTKGNKHRPYGRPYKHTSTRPWTGRWCKMMIEISLQMA
jgi:hypothetical protein